MWSENAAKDPPSHSYRKINFTVMNFIAIDRKKFNKGNKRKYCGNFYFVACSGLFTHCTWYRLYYFSLGLAKFDAQFRLVNLRS